MRHALRVDDGQQVIVEALRRAGVAVEVVGQPLDLLCAVKAPTGVRTLLLEVKDPDGRLTKAQVAFIGRWPGELHVVKSPEEALRACFGKAMD